MLSIFDLLFLLLSTPSVLVLFMLLCYISMLTFFFVIFLLQVEKSLTTQFPSVGNVEGSVVSTTRLGLSMSLKRQDFTATSASLHLVCRSILPGIPGAKARETKAIIFLTASNEKLAQEAPTPFSSTAHTNYSHLDNNKFSLLIIITFIITKL